MTAPALKTSGLSAQEEAVARAQFANALTFLRAREATTGLSGISLSSSIADSIARLDSSQADSVETLGGTNSPPYLSEPNGTGLGELQRIQSIRTALLGDDGLIARLRRS